MTADPPRNLSRGEHFTLALAVAEALEAQVSTQFRMVLLRRFGFDPAEHEGTWLEDLLGGEESDLIELADFFKLSIPIRSDHPTDVPATGIPSASAIDTCAELVAAETAFREIVRSTIGDAWAEQLSPEKIDALREKRDAEDKRRDGVSVSQDLLDYTEAYQLEPPILNTGIRPARC
ncbi:hypothetical protein [Mycobacterium sp. GA-2829]|uniref:hypothetical protein n=1 Tax=Mycobacterium sp. GA-2829 TaxID=1772283 RepID=UPI00073FD8F9|nr:hypothetical protein [Mycobacterium sp. GA-2829]KUI36224.1 hypothetical protein AU194_16035 [Mycobacterium sp. GA-2829]